MFQETSQSILRSGEKGFHYLFLANGRVGSDSLFHDNETTVSAETQHTRSKNNDTLENINKGWRMTEKCYHKN